MTNKFKLSYALASGIVSLDKDAVLYPHVKQWDGSECQDQDNREIRKAQLIFFWYK